MAFMHRVNQKQIWALIAVSTVLLCASLIPTKSDDGPSEEIRRMDALLLSDLQQQEVVLDAGAKETMECSGISDDELRSLFTINNVNYSKCEPGNCHYTSYTIESTTSSGKNISFVLTSGEDGNHLQKMQVEGCFN